MFLEKAISAHKISDKNAGKFYLSAYKNKEYSEALFQNFGALQRELGNEKEAQKIYVQGLKLYPDSIKIKLNYANVLRSESPIKSLDFYLQIF